MDGGGGPLDAGLQREPWWKPPTWWVPWRKLGWLARIRRGGAIAFAVFHLAAMFAMGTPSEVRKHFNPVFGFYDSRLKMTNTWGMFSKRPSSMHVRVEAVDRAGKVTVIADTHSVGKSLLERFADGRLRKIQSKLDSPKDRVRFGSDYLDGWCRFRALSVPDVTEVRAVQETHEMRDDRDRVTRKAQEAVVLRRTCGKDVRPRTLPVYVRDEDNEDGADN